MSLNLEQKKAVVAELAEIAGAAQSAIAADYSGLSVDDMTELRSTARSSGVYLRVVRNTLARRALEQTEFACMCDEMTGPLLFAFANEDPAAPARLFTDFRKSHDKLQVKLVALSGKLLAPEAVESLARLPTRDQALSMLLGLMKAPITMLARTLAEPHAKLVRTLAAVRDQKQSA